MAKSKRAEPERQDTDKAGLSRDQENALLAIEQAMSEMRAHGDAMSQWRLAQIAGAVEALDRGQHQAALSLVERARMPPDHVSEADRAEAAKFERRLEIEQLRAVIAARRRR